MRPVALIALKLQSDRACGSVNPISAPRRSFSGVSGYTRVVSGFYFALVWLSVHSNCSDPFVEELMAWVSCLADQFDSVRLNSPDWFLLSGRLDWALAVASIGKTLWWFFQLVDVYLSWYGGEPSFVKFRLPARVQVSDNNWFSVIIAKK